MKEWKGAWQFAQCLRPCEAYLLYQEDRDKASEEGRVETIVQDEETRKQDL